MKLDEPYVFTFYVKKDPDCLIAKGHIPNFVEVQTFPFLTVADCSPADDCGTFTVDNLTKSDVGIKTFDV